MLKFSGLASTLAGSSARQMSLTEVLPVEPVIPTTRQPSSSRQARASDWSEARGSVAPSTQPDERPPLPLPLHGELAAPLGRDQDPPGALAQRGGPELATVESLARQADEQVSLPYLA